MYFEIGAVVAVINVISVFIMLWLQTGPTEQLQTRMVIEKGLGMRKFWFVLCTAALVSVPIIMLVWPVTLFMRFWQLYSYLRNLIA